MKLLVDCGNTRLKWRMVGDGAHEEGGLRWDVFAPQDLIDDWQQALMTLGSRTENPRGMFCSVAPAAHTAKAWAALQAFCSASGAQRLKVHPGAKLHHAGFDWTLTTDYERPEELGRDRWAAALGFVHLFARQAQTQSMRHRDSFSVVLVSAGTATVVDRVSGAWDGSGWVCTLAHGQIQPGLQCSADALAESAPALKPALQQALSLSDERLDWPLFDHQGSTQRAVTEGLMAAQLGGLFWAERILPFDAIWLHGGNADWWRRALQASPWRGQWTCIQAPLIFAGLEAALTLESSAPTASSID